MRTRCEARWLPTARCELRSIVMYKCDRRDTLHGRHASAASPLGAGARLQLVGGADHQLGAWLCQPVVPHAHVAVPPSACKDVGVER